MKQWFGTIPTKSEGHGETIDITPDLEDLLLSWGADCGQGVLFAPGSTTSITTIEFAPGVVKDLSDLLEKLAPEGIPYNHDSDWGDQNGYAHVRAALIGPSLPFIVKGGKLVRGRWQQFVMLDFDNRPRARELEVQFTGTSKGSDS